MEDTQENKTLVLAFDIERLGATDIYDTISIGAVVVSEDLSLHDVLLCDGYFENAMIEGRCWDEFWKYNTQALTDCIYNGSMSKCDRQADMIAQFQAFRRKWETLCEIQGWKLEVVCDNPSFDVTFLNIMIFQHRPGELPLPYTAEYPQKFKSLWETHSEQRGLLMVVDPDFVRQHNYGFTKRIEELYDVPKKKMEWGHDHKAHHDAYNIACEQQILNGIMNGKIQKRSTPKEAEVSSF